MPNDETSARRFDLSLLVKEGRQAYCTAMRITRSSTLAEDAVQNAYAFILSHPPQFLGDEQMIHCFLIKVRQCAKDVVRSERRRRKREENCVPQTPRVAVGPEGTSEGAELALAARLALDALPLEEREAISLCCEQGFSRKAAAVILSVSKQTVIHRVNRGLNKLRKVLTRQGFAVATPLAVGAALSSLPLPPVSSTLMLALQKLAANPSLAAKHASAVSAKAFAGVPTKSATAGIVWSAIILIAAAVAVTVSIPMWKNAPDTNSTVSAKTPVALSPAKIETSDTETIYDDYFNGDKLDPFWEKAAPEAQVKVGSIDNKSALVLSVAGPDANKRTGENLTDEASVLSQAVAWQQDVLVILVTARAPTAFSTRSAVCYQRLNLLDGSAKPIEVRPIVEESSATAKAQSRDEGEYLFSQNSSSDSVHFYYLYPSGKVFCCQNKSMLWGRIVTPIKSLRLKLRLLVEDPTVRAIWPVTRVVVRRLKSLPEENVGQLLNEMLAEQPKTK